MVRTNRARPGSPTRAELRGTEWELTVDGFAHGGHGVARHEGLVVFVRHALPGERVRAVVTRGREGDRFVHADAVEIVTPSPHRVPPPCPYAADRSCGGCDLQHVDLDHQRSLKAGVIAEQLRRLAGIERDITVRAVPGDEAGLRWRTRVEFAVDPTGRAGLHPFHSDAVTPVQDCLIATRAVIASGVLDTTWAPGREDVGGIDSASAGSEPEPIVAVDVIDAAHPAEPVLVPLARGEGRTATGGLVGERVVVGDWEGEYVVSARGFWQVHPGAASTFLARVTQLLDVRDGDHVLDLFAGSGLFTMRLGELVGEAGAVLGVEGDEHAVANGSDNCAHLASVEWRANRVDRELRSLVRQGIRADLVVLDPPRTGAGREVMELVAAVQPRRIVYVACDPSALARDVGVATGLGYTLAHAEGWDAFPMTHHVETIAVLERTV